MARTRRGPRRAGAVKAASAMVISVTVALARRDWKSEAYISSSQACLSSDRRMTWGLLSGIVEDVEAKKVILIGVGTKARRAESTNT